jgi:CRP-like cAMP-binding protein
MPDHSDPRIEELKPRLIDEIQFIEFKKNIVYLKDRKNSKFLKLQKGDADIVSEFDGSKNLSELLRNQLEKNGTTQFQRIFSLLVLLNEHGFLASDGSSLSGSNFYLFKQKTFLKRLAEIVSMLGAFTIINLRWTFDAPPLRKIASGLLSLPGLAVLFAIAIGNNFIPFDYKDIDITDFFLNVNTYHINAGIYLLSIIIIWLSTCCIISLKNVLSAFAMSARGLTVIKPRIRFFLGLVYFDFDASDIVSAGIWGVARFYAFRIILPFTLMSCISLLTMLGVSVPFISLFKEVCMLVAGFSLSPLANTDMNRALGMLTNSTNSFIGNVDFLRKKYLSQFLNFKKLSMQGLDFSHIMAGLTILWIVIFVLFLNYCISAISLNVVQTQLKGFSWNSLFIITQFMIMITPLFVQVMMTLYIALSNIQVFLKTPVRRMTNFADSLTHQIVPAERETVNFLKEIPLLVGLDDNDLQRLCKYLKLVQFGSQCEIIVQGEIGDAFYLIISGMVAIEIEDEFGTTRVVDILTTGHSFGEVALIENVPRTATVRSITPVNLFVLHRKYFKEFVRDWTGGTDRITDVIRDTKLLMDSPLFSYLPPSRMRAIVARFETNSYGPDKIIFNQGDQGDRVFMIKKGQVEIQRIEDGKSVLKKILARGEWLGEIALVKNVPRTASAKTLSETILLSLSKKDFYETMQHSLMTGVEFNKLAEKRLFEINEKSPHH